MKYKHLTCDYLCIPVYHCMNVSYDCMLVNRHSPNTSEVMDICQEKEDTVIVISLEKEPILECNHKETEQFPQLGGGLQREL
jgi:hypothetical protein